MTVTGAGSGAPRPRRVALVGPTATGKSAVALAAALADGATDIVSVDSMCVYRGMDIGTAKPGPAARAAVPHHLLDLVDPDRDFSVAEFQAAADAALAAVAAAGRRVLLVGGTGLYLRSVVDGLTLPGRFPEVAAALEAEADGPDGVAALHRRLATLDPVAAARTTATNRRRVVRALEVTFGAGRPFSSFGPGLEAYPPTDVVLLGLAADPDGSAVAERFARFMADGLLDEVRALAARPEGLSRTARQALGYRELLAHVEDGVPLERCVDEAVRRTRVFARRQRAWFRRDPRIRWLGDGEDPAAAVAAALGGSD